ncbi:MAG: leucine-rich repeat protein [Clostridia bacterium]|nr:leucine-rich repeat protein [Clostridia bacterium]
MKKLFSVLLSIMLVLALTFSVTACKKGNEESFDENVDPVNFVIKSKTVDDVVTHTLTEFSLSAAAKNYVDNEDYDGLKKLFENHAENTKDLTVLEDGLRLTIPAEVTHIETNALSNLAYVTELVVGSAVEEISEGAFAGLSSLKKITIPFVGGKLGAVDGAKLFGYIFGTVGGDGLTAITQTFNDSNAEDATVTASYQIPSSLETVVITGDVKQETSTIYYYINDDQQEVEVTVEEGETAPTEVDGKPVYSFTNYSYENSAIQPFAFHSVTMIKEVVFAEGVTVDEIPDYAFYGCTGIKTLNVTAKVVGKYAFANCSSLRLLTLTGVEEVKDGAFSGCTTLGTGTAVSKNKLDLSSLDLDNIGDDAFSGCTSLKYVLVSATLDDDTKARIFGENEELEVTVAE